MYLKHIDNFQIDKFIKNITCSNCRNVIVADSDERQYIDVFSNMLSSIYHITDYECIETNTGKIYSKEWRKFMIAELDKVKLGDNYIDGLHDYLEADTICGPIL